MSQLEAESRGGGGTRGHAMLLGPIKTSSGHGQTSSQEESFSHVLESMGFSGFTSNPRAPELSKHAENKGVSKSALTKNPLSSLAQPGTAQEEASRASSS